MLILTYHSICCWTPESIGYVVRSFNILQYVVFHIFLSGNDGRSFRTVYPHLRQRIWPWFATCDANIAGLVSLCQRNRPVSPSEIPLSATEHHRFSSPWEGLTKISWPLLNFNPQTLTLYSHHRASILFAAIQTVRIRWRISMCLGYPSDTLIRWL